MTSTISVQLDDRTARRLEDLARAGGTTRTSALTNAVHVTWQQLLYERRVERRRQRAGLPPLRRGNDFYRRRVEAAVAGKQPGPVGEYSIVVRGRRWPPEQVMALACRADPAEVGTDMADFARDLLTGFGYVAVRHRERNPADLANGRPDGQDRPPDAQAEAPQPFVGGEYVALRHDEVLVTADSFEEIVKWLRRHRFPGV